MLDLINAERAKAGLDPVVLGDNAAAQLHAESSFANCFLSHWGVDGLKPYMRYSLAGGYQSSWENLSGWNYCIKSSEGYRAPGSIQQNIRETMDGWMDSPGHRDNILYPWHKRVNIGLAWDTYNLFKVQHFEGDHVEYTQLPAIENGILTMSGTVKNGAGFASERDLGVQVFYDQTPHTLTRGQLSRTHCYDGGRLIAALRPPLPPDRFYDENEFTSTISRCIDPYAIPADTPAPEPPGPAIPPPLPYRYPFSIIVPWITALEWTTSADAFSIRADLSWVLSKHGDGVYNIFVWDVIDGEDVVISEYPIFYGVTPPDTYD